MKSLCAALLAAALPIMAFAAAPSPAPAAAENWAQDKTADELWNRVQSNLPGAQSTKEETGQRFEKLQSGYAAFAKRFPDDPRAWEAKIVTVQIASSLSQFGKASLPPSQAAQQLAAIAADPKAPEDAKQTARMLALPFLASSAGPADLLKALDDYRRDFPDAEVSPQIKLLIAEKVETSNPDRAKGLLAEVQKFRDAAMAAEAEAAKKTAALLNKPADVKFTAVDGTPIDVSKMSGKVVLLDFWATWCGPCMRELPDVLAAYKKYHDRGFEIIGISFDEDKDTLLKTTKEKGMVWPQYFDGKGWKNDFGDKFGIHAIPQMWLVNKKGVLVNMQARDELENSIEKLLAEK